MYNSVRVGSRYTIKKKKPVCVLNEAHQASVVVLVFADDVHQQVMSPLNLLHLNDREH